MNQTETDKFIEKVNEQIKQKTFDPNDAKLLIQLVECLADSRGITRLSIVETFGKIGKSATPFLEEALLHHNNPVVRRSSAKAIAVIADSSAVPNLIQALLTDSDTIVRGSSVGALAKMGELAVPALLNILESPESPASAKGHAAWALAFIGTEAQAYLKEAFASDSQEVRAAVVSAIAKFAQEKPEEEGLEILIEALEDSATTVRCEAAIALGDLGYQPALKKLVKLLHHSDWETRKAAALALMKFRDVQALEPLQKSLEQESEVAVTKVIELAISQIQKFQDK